MVQHHPNDAPGEVNHGLMGLPPAYFQAGGWDLSRDDSFDLRKGFEGGMWHSYKDRFVWWVSALLVE